MNQIEFDESRFVVKLGDYATGPADAISDPLIQPRAQEYRRRLSGLMRPLSGEDIYRIPNAKGYFCTRKYDGEFALVIFDGSETFSVNPGGTVRRRLSCFTEATELLSSQSIKSCILAGELYKKSDSQKRNRVHHVIRTLRSPESISDLEKIGLAVFDVVSLDDSSVDSVSEVFNKLGHWFGGSENVHPVEYRKVDSVASIHDLYGNWVIAEGAEGIVVRHDQAGWFKVKQRHTIDAAIIGFSEGSDERKGLLHDLLVALMRDDGSFHELCRVGGGFTEDDRRELAENLQGSIVPSEYIAVNSDYVAYQMIAPGPVIEVSCLDIISENSKGGAINKTVLGWDQEKYTTLVRMPLVSVISPQFIRVREDKEANIEDVNIRQISELFDVADTDKPSNKNVLQPSEILERVVYTKTLKGQRMVRKLLLWKTNKDDESGFPEYVVYLTDFSPNRQNPLERDIRISRDEIDARNLFADLATKNFLKGWEQII